MSSLATPVFTRPAVPRPASADVVIAARGEEFVLPASAQTLAGFRAWAASDEAPEHLRVCFLNGEVYIDMSGDHLESHNPVKLEILHAIVTLNKKLRLGRVHQDGAQVTHEGANLSSMPDGVFFSWEAYQSGRVRLASGTGEGEPHLVIEGSPDWVLEVVSNSSVRKDTRRLRDLYHRANILEYWIVDARGEEIDFQLLRWETEGYVEVSPDRQGWRESRVFGRMFRLRRRRDEGGLWEYVLQMKKSS